MKSLLLFVSMMVVSVLSCASKLPASKQERGDIKLAEVALITAQIADIHATTRYRCSAVKGACLGVPQQELALSLIAARDTEASNEALVRLLRIRMDGGLSTDYQCIVLGKAQTLVRQLQAIQPSELHEECKREVLETISRNGSLFKDFSAQDVCAGSAQIDKKRSELITAITNKKKCPAGDY